MRNVSLYMMMSYDGYLATENNRLDWMIPDPSMVGDDLLTSTWDTAILGYGGYKELSAYWRLPRKTIRISRKTTRYSPIR